MTWCDSDLLGESIGPNAQPGLRRAVNFESNDLRSLIHGALIGRGAQVKSDQQEATVPAAAELFVWHGARNSLIELRKCFRLEKSKADGVDPVEKICTIVFNEDSVRNRKKRVRTSGGYSCQTTLVTYSGRQLVPDLATEKKRSIYSGYNTGDVLGFVESTAPAMQWQTTRSLKEKILGPKALSLTTAEELGTLVFIKLES